MSNLALALNLHTLLSKAKVLKSAKLTGPKSHFSEQLLPGASMRNSAHGKGHEEGGLAYAKV